MRGGGLRSALSAGLLLSIALSPAWAQKPAKMTEQEAFALGTEAYVSATRW